MKMCYEWKFVRSLYSVCDPAFIFCVSQNGLQLLLVDRTSQSSALMVSVTGSFEVIVKLIIRHKCSVTANSSLLPHWRRNAEAVLA